ncbi:GNAT family N-acetyltransferase [Paraburkholderia sp.]|uniref:GNAT family N-acetyltransferase n=1 Tax=Paraburkholderia sp. TaxID=1926495 RepID=UPI002385B726|nr:GNAT family N-acetyltransferase [Paraburkholderia sp.]MDE1184716.1 GNAT family N-acetyltransferase [Paraburkholderia sp.]
MIQIREARFPDDLDAVQTIFREYAASLGIDLGFQDFDAELAALPGKYASPDGTVLLATRDGELLGCVAMRPLDPDVCEMKRLYIRPAARGLALGRQLAVRICEAAERAGYSRIRLDTLPSMTAALQLYASLDFKPIPAYVFNPVEGTKYLERALDGPRRPAPSNGR